MSDMTSGLLLGDMAMERTYCGWLCPYFGSGKEISKRSGKLVRQYWIEPD
jgi:hypothetical protein